MARLVGDVFIARCDWHLCSEFIQMFVRHLPVSLH